MTIKDDLLVATAKAGAAAQILHDVANGPASGSGSTVATTAGSVKTVAKVIGDSDAALQTALGGLVTAVSSAAASAATAATEAGIATTQAGNAATSATSAAASATTATTEAGVATTQAGNAATSAATAAASAATATTEAGIATTQAGNAATSATGAAASATAAAASAAAASAAAGGGAVKVSATDTTADYLSSSLTAGSNITLSVVNGGANETLRISVSGLATVATSGAYGDLSGRPTLGTAAALAVDTDGTLAANSDTSVPSQKAVKTYAAGLAVAQTFTKAQRGAPFTLADASIIAWDMSQGNNYEVQLGGNRTLGVPTGGAAGQSGSLNPIQDAAGSRTLAYSWCYTFFGSTPSLSTGGYAWDKLSYDVVRFQSATVTMTVGSVSASPIRSTGMKNFPWLKTTVCRSWIHGTSPISSLHFPACIRRGYC